MMRGRWLTIALPAVLLIGSTFSVRASSQAAGEALSYPAVRDALDAARAAGDLATVRTRLIEQAGAWRDGLRAFIAGYAALLSYDRDQALRMLTRSVELDDAPDAAAALAAHAVEIGNGALAVDWASRGLARLEHQPAGSGPGLEIELRLARAQGYFWLAKSVEQRQELRASLRLARAAGDRQSEALALHHLGTERTNAGDPAAGLEALTEAIRIAEQHGNRRALAYGLLALSAPYPSAHPFAAKIPILDRALALSIEVRDRILQGRVLGTRGAAFMLLARHGDAMRDLLAAGSILHETGATRSRAAATGNLSLLFNELGDLAQAEQQSRLSLALYRQAGHANGALQSLNDLAGLALRQGDTARALDWQQQVVATARAQQDRLYLRPALRRLGMIHLARHDHAAAERAMVESLNLSEESGDPYHRASSQAAIGDLFRRRHRAAEARSAFETALALAPGIAGEASVRVRAHHGLGLIATGEGRPLEAAPHFRAAIEAVELAREAAGGADLQLTYFADKRALYVDAVAALVAAGHLHEAFAVVERAKARTLLDAMADRGDGAAAPAVSSAASVARGLERGDLLIDFIVGAERSFAFTLTPAGVLDVYPLPPRAALDARVREFRDQVTRRPAPTAQMGNVRRHGEALFRTLLSPALARAEGVRRLVIAADGLLFYLPFDAMTLPGTHTYVAERYDVVRTPSGSVLAANRARQTTEPLMAFAGFGDPVLGGGGAGGGDEVVRALERSGFSFAPLPGTKREVEAAAAVFHAAGARVYTGTDFTAKNAIAELQRPNRIVHFATHAVLDERVPGRSGIVVSQPEDGAAPVVLRASELARLTIRADLVTLSACQTGLGPVVDGEGVMGLAWALGHAGARALVVTLWEISDAASATTMVTFYRELAGGRSKAAALGAARRAMIAGPNPALRHPYYWAGYALIGDSR